MTRIRPAALLVVAVGVSGVLIGLAVGNLRAGEPKPSIISSAGPTAADSNLVITVRGAGNPTTTPTTRPAAHPIAAPAPTTAVPAAQVMERAPTGPAASPTTPAAVGVTRSQAPNPPPPVTKGNPTPPVIKGNPNIDVAVQDGPCTVQGRSGIDSANTTPMLCTATDDGLTWLPG